ncbi:MAG: site-2 protease family protein [Patescibacteria group bacterium]
MPFLNLLFTEPAIAFAWVVAIVIAIGIHEFSHALVAKLQGDSTAELEGRVTLNPLAHLDPFGFIVLVLFGFGWGKPVPFNPYNLKARRWGPAIVSLAGPAMNVIGIIVFGTILAILARTTTLPSDNLLVIFLELLVRFNIVLALFNLLPIPPLDGSKLLGLLPDQFRGLVEGLTKYGFIILMFVIVFGQPVLGKLFNTIENLAFRFILPS